MPRRRGAPRRARRRADGRRRHRDLSRRDAGDRPSRMGCAFDVGLRALDLPGDVRDVIVLADGDEAGEAAARDCAWRWKREGRRVRIARPPQGMDFNDHAAGPRAPHRGGRAMNGDETNEPENLIAAAIDAAEDVRDPLEGLVEKDGDRSRRAVHAGGAGAACRAEERRSRRVRGTACSVEGCGLPGDGARRGYRRGKRRYWRARPDAGRHPDRPRADRPSCSTRRTEPASPTSTSTATGRPGRSAPRASAAGWRAASSRRRRARRVPRHCNRR